MSVEQNKATLYRNFDEIWNNRNLALIPELVSPDYVGTNVFGVTKAPLFLLETMSSGKYIKQCIL